ncbi:MAG: DUF1295 domain-containing protein [Bacteroidales bacterium]|nr:DUF1295 domain-containing protein [Bacteroidales bacterium]
MNFSLQQFNWGLIGMSVLAVIVFIALFFIKAGYGQFQSKKWGAAINNKIGWCIMETPVFVTMWILWSLSDRKFCIVPCIFFLFFEVHYFYRALVFPFLMKGKSKMALSIMFIGVFFNVINALMQGGWIFYFAPDNMYQISWLWSPQFIIGTILFFFGMIIDYDSDKIIRELRKPGDNNHYLPQKGFFKYVTSAHYFGEFVEWVGFAVLTWSFSGAVFAIWTFANLAPRANAIWKRYNEMFPEAHVCKTKKRMIPFIY